MRKLLSIAIVLAALYGGYWFVASRALMAGVETAMDQLRAEGQIDYASVGLAGFPSRFDVTVEAPEVRGADLVWAAPFLQVFALSYRPNQIIAVWPREQSLTIAGQRLDIASEDMRASALFAAEGSLPLDHAQMVVAAPSVAVTGQWSAAATEARLASQSAGADGRSHRVGVEVTDIALKDVEGTGGPAPALPATIERLWLDATLDFDRPLDRFAGEAPPRLMQAEIAGARLLWGPMRIEAEGRIEVTASGTPEGRITVTATEWRQMLDAAERLGALSAQDAANVARMLDGIARNSPDPDRVSLPFVFREGMLFLGPFALGPAPRL